jgi:photosystem I subunit 2
MSTASTLSGQLPQFIGSTGGLLNAAETEEKYAITWNSNSAQAFELPTGGAAMMNSGENIMYFARKEQCLALGTQLRTQFKPRIEDYKIYRIYPGGDMEFLHPKDGVFPEKVNEGRPMVGHNPRRIGQNTNPATIKFSGRNTFDS